MMMLKNSPWFTCTMEGHSEFCSTKIRFNVSHPKTSSCNQQHSFYIKSIIRGHAYTWFSIHAGAIFATTKFLQVNEQNLKGTRYNRHITRGNESRSAKKKSQSRKKKDDLAVIFLYCRSINEHQRYLKTSAPRGSCWKSAQMIHLDDVAGLQVTTGRCANSSTRETNAQPRVPYQQRCGQ